MEYDTRPSVYVLLTVGGVSPHDSGSAVRLLKNTVSAAASGGGI